MSRNDARLQLAPVLTLLAMMLVGGSCTYAECVDTSSEGEPFPIGDERVVTFRSSDRRLTDVQSDRGVWTSDDDALPTEGSLEVVATRVDDETIIVDFGETIGLVSFAEVSCQ